MYTISIGYTTLCTYAISSLNCDLILIDCYGVVMLDMMRIADAAIKMVEKNAAIENGKEK